MKVFNPVTPRATYAAVVHAVNGAISWAERLVSFFESLIVRMSMSSVNPRVRITIAVVSVASKDMVLVPVLRVSTSVSNADVGVDSSVMFSGKICDEDTLRELSLLSCGRTPDELGCATSFDASVESLALFLAIFSSSRSFFLCSFLLALSSPLSPSRYT